MKAKGEILIMSGVRPTRFIDVSSATRNRIADRLALRRNILDLIYRRRAVERDPNIGASVERQILGSPIGPEEGSRQ